MEVFVADDLDAVAPRIEEVEERTGNDLHAGVRERLLHRLLVVDDEPEVAAVIGALAAALLPREELVAQDAERVRLAATAQHEPEQLSVERQRLVDVAGFP